jgi:hypothetical protein
MPERTFRVVIANPTADLNLVQTFNHLCDGGWTNVWAPPGTIAPGKTGGIQGESNSFLGGTQGYVK